MEKRLGVAQLCLLLAVLVFMGLTRGSRGPALEDKRYWRSALKSFSGDWRRSRFRDSQGLRGELLLAFTLENHCSHDDFIYHLSSRTVDEALDQCSCDTIGSHNCENGLKAVLRKHEINGICVSATTLLKARHVYFRSFTTIEISR